MTDLVMRMVLLDREGLGRSISEVDRPARPSVNDAIAVEDEEEWINPALARANSAAPATNYGAQHRDTVIRPWAIAARAASVTSMKPFKVEQTSGPID